MNKEIFIKELQAININISEENLKKLDEYYKILIEENKKYNLTSILKKEQVYLKHFYDSLTLNIVEKLEKQKLLDIGSGAGFPGLVLKILFPSLDVTLLDSNNKKIIFLNLVIKKLKLKNIKVVYARAEEYIKNNRDAFDLVTSRAVAPLNVLIELAIPFLKVNGTFIAMKAKQNEDEFSLAKKAMEHLNCKLISQYKFSLPQEFSERTLYSFIKIAPTSKEFPRRYDKIIKNPLKKKKN